MVVLLRRSRRSSSAPTVAPDRGIPMRFAAVFDLPTGLTGVARRRGVRDRRWNCRVRALCYDQEWTSRGPVRRCTILSEPPAGAPFHRATHPFLAGGPATVRPLFASGECARPWEPDPAG